MLLDTAQTDRLRKQAWDYFALHASQRMTSFQYFITLATALSAAIVLLIRDPQHPELCGPIGLLLTCFAVVFSRLDKRTRQLIKNAEEVIRTLDASLLHDVEANVADRLSLFSLSEQHPGSSRYSYSKCFRAVFIIFGLAGAAIFLWASVVVATK